MANISQLQKHRASLLCGAALCLVLTLPALLLGDFKHQFDGVDILGESGVALAVALWSLLVLISRPPGRVTRWLFAGLGAIFIALWLDALDELVHMDSLPAWYGNLESIAMPLGVMLLTWGLIQWHREQVEINRQLAAREGLFREHRLLDPLSQLASVDYLCEQLLKLQNQNQAQPLSVLMVSLDDWLGFTRRHGHQKADNMLSRIAELIMLHLREGHWLCRYAGAQLVVVMPACPEREAAAVATTLEQATGLLRVLVEGEEFRPSITVVQATLIEEDPRLWLKGLNARLHEQSAPEWAA